MAKKCEVQESDPAFRSISVSHAMLVRQASWRSACTDPARALAQAQRQAIDCRRYYDHIVDSKDQCSRIVLAAPVLIVVFTTTSRGVQPSKKLSYDISVFSFAPLQEHKL